MNIKSLKAKNVFRYDKFSLDFDNKVYLILGKINNNFEGSNGAGKSALIDILLYGLYGKTLRKGITDISKDHCGEMKVKVEFDDKAIQREKNNGNNNVRFFIKGEEQIGLKKELQSYISNTIDYDLFRMITVFTPKNNFFMLSDSEKKDLLIAFTNNNNIDKIYDMVKKDYDTLKNLGLDVAISSFKTSLNAKDEVESEYKKISKKWEKYESYEKGISKYQEYFRLRKPLLAEKEELEEVFEKYKSKGKKLKKVVAEIKTSDDDLEKMLTDINKYDNHISKYEDKIEEIKNNISKLEDAGKCPTCNQALSNKKKIIEDYKDSIKDCEQQIEIAKDMKSKVKESYVIAKDEKEHNDSLIMELKEVKVKFDNAKENLEKLNKKIDGLEKQYEEYMKYADVEITLQEINNVKLKCVELKTKMENFNDREEELKKLEKRKEEVDIQLAELEEIKSVFSKDGLKQFVIQQITDFLKDRINEMVIKVFDDMEIDIRLDFGDKRNLMNIDIVRRDTIFNIEELSTGERRIIEMIFQIALNELFETVNDDSINFMVFDESFDALDKNNMHKINDMLKILEEKNKTIFIISHNESVKHYFKNFIVVEQQNGTSKLEVM